MQYVAAAGTAIAAYGQYQAGKFQRDMYNQQAQQAEMEAKQRAIEYEQKALNVLDDTLRSVASINAAAGSANLDPFSGSIANLTSYALSSGYKDFTTLTRGSEITQDMGSYQAGIYRASGKMAYQTGVYNAIGTLAMGAAQSGSTGPSNPGGGEGFGGSGSQGYGYAQVN
jgi:hypothetical protein